MAESIVGEISFVITGELNPLTGSEAHLNALGVKREDGDYYCWRFYGNSRALLAARVVPPEMLLSPGERRGRGQCHFKTAGGRQATIAKAPAREGPDAYCVRVKRTGADREAFQARQDEAMAAPATLRIVHHSARAEFSLLPHGILAVAYSGPITASTLAAFRCEIAKIHGASARAVVADYTKAAFLLDDLGLLELMAGNVRGNLPDVPVAVVTREDTAYTLRRLAITVAYLLNRARRNFADRPSGEAWALWASIAINLEAR